jgi:hypothetical protein
MVIYKTFDRWFEQPEEYGLRSERFFDHLDLITDTHERNQFITNWMRAAFEAGRNPEDKYV